LRDGYDVVVLAMTLSELSDGVLGLSHIAERLSVVVQSLAKKTLPVFLVAHSAGGLVARYFVQRLEGHLYIQGVVTLATPHRGTWVAALGFVTPLILKAKVLWEMLPVSQFIRKLNKAPAGVDGSVAQYSLQTRHALSAARHAITQTLERRSQCAEC
jgi:triacylglycerol esterase/lipase EstA (alpha/beta hydrolase family)